MYILGQCVQKNKLCSAILFNITNLNEFYGDQQREISDTGNVLPGEDRGSSEKSAEKVSGYDRATMLAKLGNGLGTAGADGNW